MNWSHWAALSAPSGLQAPKAVMTDAKQYDDDDAILKHLAASASRLQPLLSQPFSTTFTFFSLFVCPSCSTPLFTLNRAGRGRGKVRLDRTKSDWLGGRGWQSSWPHNTWLLLFKRGRGLFKNMDILHCIGPNCRATHWENYRCAWWPVWLCPSRVFSRTGGGTKLDGGGLVIAPSDRSNALSVNA